MRNIKFISSAWPALLLASLVGCSATPSGESTGQYLDDMIITSSVKAAILNEPTLKVRDINVETFKGIVQLSGFVAAPDSMATAVKVAKNINGVKSVRNELRLN